MLGEAAGVWMGELIYESAVIVNILGGSDQFPLHNLNIFVWDLLVIIGSIQLRHLHLSPCDIANEI